jgi:putative redox protein
MAQELNVTVDLANQKVRFTGAARANPPVTFDYDPPLGDGQGYTGLEGLLMSLAACSATSVVALLRKMGKSVGGFRVEAGGTRRTTHPTSLETIHLHFIVTSGDAGDEDVKKAIRLSEESICPVWAMLKGNVEIRTGFEIRKS